VIRNVSNTPVKIGDLTIPPGHRMLVPIEELEDVHVKKLVEDGVIEVDSHPESGEGG
jgi:hypothetical protein